MERTQQTKQKPEWLTVGAVVSFRTRYGTGYGTVADLGFDYDGGTPGWWTPLVADTCGFTTRAWFETLTPIEGPHPLRDRGRR